MSGYRDLIMVHPAIGNIISRAVQEAEFKRWWSSMQIVRKGGAVQTLRRATNADPIKPTT